MPCLYANFYIVPYLLDNVDSNVILSDNLKIVLDLYDNVYNVPKLQHNLYTNVIQDNLLRSLSKYIDNHSTSTDSFVVILEGTGITPTTVQDVSISLAPTPNHPLSQRSTHCRRDTVRLVMDVVCIGKGSVWLLKRQRVSINGTDHVTSA